MQKSDFLSLLEVDFGPFRGAQVAAVEGISLKNDENTACDFVFKTKPKIVGNHRKKQNTSRYWRFPEAPLVKKNQTFFRSQNGP